MITKEPLTKTNKPDIMNVHMSFKYNEDKILNDVKDYIKSTYGQHYVHKDIQVQDLFQSIGLHQIFVGIMR